MLEQQAYVPASFAKVAENFNALSVMWHALNRAFRYLYSIDIKTSAPWKRRLLYVDSKPWMQPIEKYYL